MLGLQSDKSGGAAVEQQASLYYKLIDSIPQQQSSQSVRNRSDTAAGAVRADVVEGGANGRIPMPDFMDLKSLKLVVPMRDKPNCDFSYAGESAIVYI